ncbi:MAG: hypothetical protein Q8O72_02525 [Bacteroidales bacterium]|nr:hypothetical protein [Bacteroidales bacterium]
METPKNTLRMITALALIAMFTACSSYNSLPGDDVYYSSKTRSTEATPPSNTAVVNQAAPATSDGQFDYSTQYESNVAASPAQSTKQAEDTNYQFIDDYYEGDYAARIKRFNGTGSSNDYYDEEYTSDCNGCGNSDWSFSMGVGVGMGMGYSMNYGYGWPSYGYWGYPYYGWRSPYYSWGYPYYGWGYPYYGGSYWAGYNNGYWNGYYDGYYGGGYYGGGYYGGGSYDYGRVNHYGSRGRGTGGTTIPRRDGSRSSDGSSQRAQRSPETVVGGSGATLTPRTNTVDAGTGTRNPAGRRNDQSVNTSTKTTGETTARRSQELQKPASANRRAVNTQNTSTSQEKYRKPKSYESLPSRQPRSSQEYVRTAPVTNTSRENSRSNVNTRQVVQPGATNQRSTNTRETSTYNRSRSTQNYSQPRSTSTNRNSNPARTVTPSTSTPSKSYSSPTRSQGSSSRSYSAPTTPSRSSSGSSSSGSSSSGSSSSGGSRGGRR